MNDFSIKVPGVDFTLSSNQVYHIREVSDANAPDGYQKAGISKHPLPGIEQGIIVPHDGMSWNTGFNSKCLCYKKEAKAKEILIKVEKNLIPELEDLVEGNLLGIKSDSNELFDDFIPFNGTGFGEDVSRFKIKGGNMFNTSDPLEFLALWWALISKQVMPKGKDGDPKYKECSFLLEDKQKTTTISQDREFDKSMAVSTFMSIVTGKTNKKKLTLLENVLEYVGLSISVEDLDERPLVATFNRWCEKGGYNNENAVAFNEKWEKFSDPKAEEELVTYIKLLKDIKSGKVNVERTEIFLEGQNLGSDKKSAARKIVNDQELHKAFLVI